MPHLRMLKPADRAPVDGAAASDSRPDRDVDARLEPLGCSPGVLRQRCAVDVRVEDHRSSESFRERADQVGALPGLLRRLQDLTERTGLRAQIQRPERRYADRLERPIRLRRFPQELDRSFQRLLWRGRREADLSSQIVGS